MLLLLRLFDLEDVPPGLYPGLLPNLQPEAPLFLGFLQLPQRLLVPAVHCVQPLEVLEGVLGDQGAVGFLQTAGRGQAVEFAAVGEVESVLVMLEAFFELHFLGALEGEAGEDPALRGDGLLAGGFLGHFPLQFGQGAAEGEGGGRGGRWQFEVRVGVAEALDRVGFGSQKKVHV